MLWAAILVLSACVVPAGVAHGHGLGLDTVEVTKDGMQITFTVEMTTPLNDENRRITITATDQFGDPITEIDFELGIMYEGQTILRDSFLAPDGILEIDAASDPSTGMISGQRDGDAGPWRAGRGQPVGIIDPAFGAGGLYTFEITTSSDSGRADISIIDTAEFIRSDSQGSNVTFKTRSYFDGISHLEYDPTAGTAILQMPFDWTDATILHIPVVHIEVHFPKDYTEFRANSYTGTVNGVELFRSSVTIDDYTEDDERIVHLVLLTDHLKTIKRHADYTVSDMMTVSLTLSDENQFPMRAYTAGEEFYVDLTWEPPEIEPGADTNFIFTIRDGVTGEPLRRSSYEFVIIQNGMEIHRIEGEAAVGGYFERFVFSEGQTGPTIIRFEDIRRTGAETEFGLVVVPEFGAVLPVLAAATAALAGSRLGLLRIFRAR